MVSQNAFFGNHFLKQVSSEKASIVRRLKAVLEWRLNDIFEVRKSRFSQTGVETKIISSTNRCITVFPGISLLTEVGI